MRHISLVFGVICGAIIIAIAARFGFKTSDSDYDGFIWAFTFGAVTFGGLVIHAVGLKLWDHGYKRAAGVAWAVGALALTVSLSNSLGAMAGRMNETAALHIQTAETVRDARRSLQGKESERRAMVFTATDETAVSAARIAAEAATKAREVECRGAQDWGCRKKQDAEQVALKALTTASQQKSATDLAEKLDREIDDLKRTIGKAGPVLEANSQGNALAQLFALPETWASFLSTWQMFLMAIILEVMTAGSFIIFEVLAPAKMDRGITLARVTVSPSPTARREIEAMQADEVGKLPTHAGNSEVSKLLESSKNTTNAETSAPLTKPKPAQRTKKAPVSRAKKTGKSQKSGGASSLEIGSMQDWFSEQIARSPGNKVRCGLVRASYEEWCRRHGKAPISPVDFGKALKADESDGGFGVGFENISNRASYIGISVKTALALVTG